MIPFTNPHGGIVIGAGGRTLKALMTRFGCYIESHKAQHDQNRPPPYFLIQGPHEKAVNQATIEIYRLLNTSMMNGEKKLKADIEEVVNESTHAKLLVHERDEKITELETEVEILTEKMQKPMDEKKDTPAEECQWVKVLIPPPLRGLPDSLYAQDLRLFRQQTPEEQQSAIDNAREDYGDLYDEVYADIHLD